MRLKAELLDRVRRIPAGRVATHGPLAAELRAAPKLIPGVMLSLTDTERASVPWWRVVADGGAIGRHLHRDAQVAALVSEGHLVAPAGIVQRLAACRILSFDSPQAGDSPGAARLFKGAAQPSSEHASAGNLATPSRARGSRGLPKSSL